MANAKKPRKRKPKVLGRPSEYAPVIAAEICARISAGQSFRTISRDKDMPCIQTMFTWMRKHPEFMEQYVIAKQEQAEAMTEEMLDIADDGTNDWMEKLDDESGEVYGWKVNGEHIQRSRLRVETRKWLASKLKPKKYGESTTLKGDAENPLLPFQKPVDITDKIMALIPTEELERITQEALNGGDSN